MYAYPPTAAHHQSCMKVVDSGIITCAKPIPFRILIKMVRIVLFVWRPFDHLIPSNDMLDVTWNNWHFLSFLVRIRKTKFHRLTRPKLRLYRLQASDIPATLVLSRKHNAI